MHTVPTEGFSLVASVNNKPPAVFSSASATYSPEIQNSSQIQFSRIPEKGGSLVLKSKSSNLLSLSSDKDILEIVGLS